eukprot:763461-Hanusia_phi.AAC.7
MPTWYGYQYKLRKASGREGGGRLAEVDGRGRCHQKKCTVTDDGIKSAMERWSDGATENGGSSMRSKRKRSSGDGGFDVPSLQKLEWSRKATTDQASAQNRSESNGTM